MIRLNRRIRLVTCLVGLTSASVTAASAQAQPAPAAGQSGSPSTPAVAPSTAPHAAGSAAAPSAAAVQEAGQHYDRGLALYADGDYPLAVVEFDRAYELVPNYHVLYNVGQVRIQLGHYAKARRALEQYRREGGPQIPDGRRATLAKDLELLVSRTATLMILSNQAHAEVLIDDEVVGTTPLQQPLLLNAGEHRVSLRKDGYQRSTIRRALAGRDEVSVRFDLEAVPDLRTARVLPPVLVVPDDSSRSALRWAAWSTTGALVAATAITGSLSLQAKGDLSTLRETRDVSSADLAAQKTKAETLFLAADILGGAALATGGVALYLTLTGDKGKHPVTRPPRVGVTVAPTWLGVSGSF